MKKYPKWKWIWLVLVAGLGLLYFPLASDTFRNDRKLADLEGVFVNMHHPPGTQLLSQRKKVGVFGNGNHCDFFVGQIRSYSGSKDSIRIFYEREEKRLKEGIEVRFIDDEHTDFLCCYFSKLRDWGIFEKPDHNMYLVKLFRNEDANGDMRCH